MRIFTARIEGRGEMDLACIPFRDARTHRIHLGHAFAYAKLAAFVGVVPFDLLGDDGIELRGCTFTIEPPWVAFTQRVETDFARQLWAVQAAWAWSRRHARRNIVTSRSREVVFHEMDVAGQVVLEAVARLAPLATTTGQRDKVGEVERRYGGAVRDEADRRRRSPEWLSRLSPLDGGSVERPD